jgi:hypothetical protein
MMTRRLPWLGLLLAAIAWAASHQVASDAIFDDCRRGAAAFVLLVCLAGLTIDIGGGLLALAVWRGAAAGSGRRFLGLLGMLLAALASFAIVLQAVSALIIPPCSP